MIITQYPNIKFSLFNLVPYPTKFIRINQKLLCVLNKGLVRFGSVLWHINHCWLFNPKSYVYKYILNI